MLPPIWGVYVLGLFAIVGGVSGVIFSAVAAAMFRRHYIGLLIAFSLGAIGFDGTLLFVTWLQTKHVVSPQRDVMPLVVSLVGAVLLPTWRQWSRTEVL